MCSKRGRRLVRRLRPRLDDDEDEESLWRLSRGSSSGSATAATVATPDPDPFDSGVPESGDSALRAVWSLPDPEPDPRLRDRRLRLRVRAVPVPLPDWAESLSASSGDPSSAAVADSWDASATGSAGASTSAGVASSVVPVGAERLRRRRVLPSRGGAVSSTAASDEDAPSAGASASEAGLVSSGEMASTSRGTGAPALRRGARERRSAKGTVGAPSAAGTASAGEVPSPDGAARASDEGEASDSGVALGLRVRVRGALLGLASASSPTEAWGAAGLSAGLESPKGAAGADVSGESDSADDALEAAGARRLRGALVAVGGLSSTAPAG